MTLQPRRLAAVAPAPPRSGRWQRRSAAKFGVPQGAPALALKWQSEWLLEVPPLVLCLAAAVTFASAYDRPSARETLIWLAFGTAVTLLVGRLGRRQVFWRWAAAAAVGLGTALGLYFISQFSRLGVDPKIPTVALIGSHISGLMPQVGAWAPFSNSVGTGLEGLIPLGIGLGLAVQSPFKRVVLFGASALMVCALILTMSRGAWFGLVAAGTAWVATKLASRQARPLVAASAILSVLVLGVLMTWTPGLDVVTHLAALAGGPFARFDRLDIYRRSLSLLDDVGLIGLGPGSQYALPFSRFALLIPVPFVTYPHQFTLHLWLAYGLAGLVAWAWWIGGLAAVVAAAERQHVSTAFRGAWCGIVAILVHGLTDARQAVDPWTWGPLFALCGLVIARHRRTTHIVPRHLLAGPIVCVAFVSALGLWRVAPLEAAWHTGRGIVDESLASFGDGSPADRAALVETATQHYLQAIAGEPSHVSARRRLALLAADRNDFSGALRHALIALEGDAAGFATRKTAGLAAVWAGDLALARRLLEPSAATAGELRAWSAAWKERGQLQVADNALRLSTEFEIAATKPLRH
jgi:O-antigen ligase